VRAEIEYADIPEIDWSDRARDLFPGDASLARSLARMASFVGTTREGHTVRIIPRRAMEVA